MDIIFHIIMKRLLLIAVIIATCILLTASTPMENTNSTPHVVISGEVWLLTETGEKLFLLPDSYYARINNLDESYYYVTFNGVNGKVNKNIVSTTGYHTTAQGTMCDINVASEYAEFVSINLKSRPDLSSENVTSVPINEPFTFLGVYPAEDGRWYYVKYAEYYGYLKQERTTMPSYEVTPFVPETLPVVAPEETPSEEDNSEPEPLDSNLKIIIIVGLAVPAVFLVILLFKNNNKKERYYRDE